MKHYKRAVLLALCLFCALTLSACHTDSDPWPASHPSGGAPAGDAAAPAATEEINTDAQWALPGTTPTPAAAPDHEIDTGAEPGLNG